MSVTYADIENTPITELAKMALKKPEDFGYWGDDEMFVTWGFSGHDETGMATIYEKANFKSISQDLISRFPDDFRIENYRHWACGWVDRLVCRILIHKDKGFVEENITEAFRKAIEYHINLQDYPIFDEDLYYEMQAEEIVRCITDLPRNMLDMIDEDDFAWVDKVIQKLDWMNVYIDPDAQLYPKDNEILEAVYLAEVWNPENIELWEEWCKDNNFAYPPRKKNPNQLSLFETES